MVASTTLSQLRKCLSEVSFPANKADLVSAAERTGCDGETIRALRGVAPETYTNVAQVAASVTIADESDVSDRDKAAARRTHTKPGRAESAKEISGQSPIVDELGENRGS
ncbi:DUF2795 domain-containing protein [Mycobacterium sp. 94-17]|uniref:DUF2795 domain-containing protein n=1 Tax=Mycobacterium sp. 94-17 TaxID=2986147 RepID=UPI002D1EF82A|nr:DUF2795 domain-containing protein [Mycobacterium sp. 94-17]MEB4208726.1 DUF2795 domain-containing protein [Mycobacterium sp. 94-17]